MVNTVHRPRPAWHSQSRMLVSRVSWLFPLQVCFFSSHQRMNQFLRGCLQLPPLFLSSYLIDSPPWWPSCPSRCSSEPHVCISSAFRTPPPGYPTGTPTPSPTLSPTSPHLRSAQYPALLPAQCHFRFRFFCASTYCQGWPISSHQYF